MLTRRAMLAAGAVGASGGARHGARPEPARGRFRRPSKNCCASRRSTTPAISPDGEQLAILRTQVKDGKTSAFVTLSRMADLSAQPAVALIGEQSASHVEWANNERLLIWITYEKDDKGQPYGLWFYDAFVPIPVKRVISVDLKGEDPVVMFAGSRSVLRRGFDASGWSTTSRTTRAGC